MNAHHQLRVQILRGQLLALQHPLQVPNALMLPLIVTKIMLSHHENDP